ncbi:unnamed protein product [Caenorhabditis auriculariae]|uniref:F-box domain-containing protein n=1 Tax=Caenorhabditis auriculariae TaxID=2777116 RepID=A0A8S1HCG7_9PELO|nr:unnamed protein product [Caenorhabditis auriculariae]
MPLPLNIVEKILDNADYRTLLKFSRSSRMANFVAQPLLQERKAPISAKIVFELQNDWLRDCVCVTDIQDERKMIEWSSQEGVEQELYKDLSQYVSTHVVLHVTSSAHLKKTSVFPKFAEMGLFAETKTLTFHVDKRMGFRNYAKWFPNLYRYDGQRNTGTLIVRKQFRGLSTFRKFIGNYPASEFFRLSMNVSEDVIVTDDCLDFIMEQHRAKKTPLKVFVLNVESQLRANVNKIIEFLKFAAWSCVEYKAREPQNGEEGAEQNAPRCYIEISSPFEESDDDSKTKMKFALQRMGVTPTETAWKPSRDRFRPEYLFFCWVFKLGTTEMVFRLQDPPYDTEFQNVVVGSPYNNE